MADELITEISCGPSAIFNSPTTFAIAHCISADLAMGAGFAKELMTRYDSSLIRNTLRMQNLSVGGVGFVQCGDRVILNLVSKLMYYHKPTLSDIVRCIRNMHTMCEERSIRSIAMPRIGCGLDRQCWKNIRAALVDEFNRGRGTESASDDGRTITIHVYDIHSH